MSKDAKPQAGEKAKAQKAAAKESAAKAEDRFLEEHEEKEAEALQAELDRLKNEMLRQRADFENARKRIEKQKRDELKFSLLPLMSDLLTVMDHLELALKYAPDDDPLRQGVNMALEDMKKVFKRYNLEPIASLGKEFDPSFHEALSVCHDPAREDNIIVEEQRVGYRLFDRVLRAARVVVNRHPAREPEEKVPAEKPEAEE